MSDCPTNQICALAVYKLNKAYAIVAHHYLAQAEAKKARGVSAMLNSEKVIGHYQTA